ncbi:UNVERIFIED_CONTAM: IS3 family transposase [Kocuria sp. CPCC 205274]
MQGSPGRRRADGPEHLLRGPGPPALSALDQRCHDDRSHPEGIQKVHADNYGVYGVSKVHAELRRQGHRTARCTVLRLMRAAGLRGITRAKGPRTTVAGTGPKTCPHLVERSFLATAPDRLWVADITSCRIFAGWVYAAFVIDVFSRRVVGWQLSTSLRTDLALTPYEMGLWTRAHQGHDTRGVIHHSDKGVQYVAVRYTQRLAEAGAVASVGSTGDSYDCQSVRVGPGVGSEVLTGAA